MELDDFRSEEFANWYTLRVNHQPERLVPGAGVEIEKSVWFWRGQSPVAVLPCDRR